jgi:hypothetical protein
MAVYANSGDIYETTECIPVNDFVSHDLSAGQVNLSEILFGGFFLAESRRQVKDVLDISTGFPDQSRIENITTQPLNICSG